jgi:RNA polymerase sigma factor (sigma-70 family)
LAAFPSAGRAARVERGAASESDVTRDLFERFAAQIFGYCFHQLGSREEAEDAVQTTFMNALRGLQRGIVPRIESAWLFKIAHNVCLSRRRSTVRRGKVEAPNNFEVLQDVVPARERNGDELIRLQDVLEEMPESQRRAILLREWQGLSYREIADELGLTQSAVETLIFRARRSLASGLEVESRQWRKRARHGLDAGGLVAALKGLLTAGAAAKVAVAVAVAVATTAVVASAPGSDHAVQAPRTRSVARSQSRVAVFQPGAATPVTQTHVSVHPAVRSRTDADAAQARGSRRKLTGVAPSTGSSPALSATPRSRAERAGGRSTVGVAAGARPGARLVKGHGKHLQARAAREAVRPVPAPGLSQQDASGTADGQGGADHGNGRGH